MRQIPVLLLLSFCLVGCQQAYYATMEKFGVEKREILVDRVKDARDAQVEGQQQFKDALDELSQLLKFHGGDLQQRYEALSAQYEDSKKSADEVTSRINKVETVAFDLFDEWEAELAQYQNKQLKIIALEKKLSAEINIDGINFPIKLKGIVDRIDELDGVTRIIDYKTGKTLKQVGLDKKYFGQKTDSNLRGSILSSLHWYYSILSHPSRHRHLSSPTATLVSSASGAFLLLPSSTSVDDQFSSVKRERKN